MRRFNSYSDYFKLIFGGRVQKISIEVAEAVASAIQRNYIPALEAIC